MIRSAIQAGAGTGKTTRVVRLLLERLLCTDTEPSRLMALTFTVRAANEMRDRLGSWLVRLVNGLPVRELGGGIDLFDAVDRARPRGARALAELDRIEIGTIHSFAAHLLRQYPIEAGVSPDFAEDDGAAQAALFRELWPPWLDAALLSHDGETIGVDILDRCDLGQLRSFASTLCDEDTPVDEDDRDVASAQWDARLDAAATETDSLHARHALALQAAHPQLVATLRYMTELFRSRTITSALRRRQRLLDEQWPAGRAWKPDLPTFRRLQAFARRCVDCDEGAMTTLRAWLRPFVLSFRREYTRRGFVSFQGLLVRAAQLLRDHLDIRDHLKRRFRLVLVDEFQDTDPLQGEILLFLGERIEAGAREARDVELEPGKLVIVGDEKQSIYLFRGADLEAYQAVTQRLTKGRPDAVERLSVNYRARRELVHFVNAVGDRTMKTPDYAPIIPGPHAAPGGTIEMVLFPHLDARSARAREAGVIAEWVQAGAAAGDFRVGDVAVLLRTLGSAEYYTEAFRARGIDFLIEGEKHFYAAPEVVDVLNLLSAIADPADERAIVGVLRSPFGAVADADLVALRDADALSAVHRERVPGQMPHVRRLYGRLASVHARCARVPIGDLLREIVEEFAVLPMARITTRGDHAVANVRKLLTALGRTGEPLAAALAEQRRRFRAREVEGEAVLGDEALDAARIMSVHKAKGLEFPVVVLADLHREAPIAERRPVLRQWVQNRIGFRCGSICTPDWILAAEHQQRVQEEEERRVLYVALTRAKERLLLTGGRRDRGLLGLVISALSAENLPIGDGHRQCLHGPGFDVNVRVHEEPVPAATSPDLQPGGEEPDYAAARAAWDRRRRECEQISGQPALQSPSHVVHGPDDVVPRGAAAEQGDDTGIGGPASLGTRCHEVLARIDFADTEQWGMDADVGEVLRPFFRTSAFEELRHAERCYRELPFLIELDGRIWSGQIDLVYRIDGRWIVADYKSDRTEEPERYRTQAMVYAAAAERALGLASTPEFRLIYLRTGRSIPLTPVSPG